jgi:ubiquinone/menaquinone biosynthesis C-methylase UbiE
MKEIDSNKDAWSKISKDHYLAYKSQFEKGSFCLNQYITQELGDISGKDIIHLQCNTGADTIALAKMGAAHVVGVDLVPENIYYAKKLALDLGVTNVDFIESDIMTLAQVYSKKHDIVFTSEGVLGWLPDLDVWARTIRGLCNEAGFLYVFDSHPFFLMLDESKLDKEIYEIEYPYFGKSPDVDTTIGGYASEPKGGVKAYFWMHTVSDIINSLAKAGMHIEYFNEYTDNFFNSGNMEHSDKTGLYKYTYNIDKYPMSFSLKATL